MKRGFITACAVSLMLVTVIAFSNRNGSFLTKGKGFTEEEEESQIPLQDRMDLAMQQEFEITKDPSTNTVPRERLLYARQYAQQLRDERANERVTASIAGMNWTERGPNNIGGRTRAIMVDPNDPTKKICLCSRRWWRHLENNRHHGFYPCLDSNQ